ncbi:ABC transporter permease [Oryzibacter oryziterrae]|uniref:ABC transporter permease n=1 Tax=Oryzibacter oryziterrae TaxID=2766474 RepID=UPI001F297CD0|nr:ABC transporter permease subunit [Oryzibacter oryziterrae]
MSGAIRIATVATTEFRLAVRNRWVLLATLTLTGFALALAFLGSGPSGELKVDPLTLTAASLSTLSVYLVPLIALLVSYDSLAGELERGTLSLVLATPIRRTELLIAKFLGHLAVLALAIVVGYGIAALAVIERHGLGAHAAGLVVWFRLMATCLLLGAVFVGLGMAVSASCRQTGTAAALSVGLWLLLVVLYDLALLGAIIVDRGGLFTKTIFPFLVLANPGDAFRLFNLAQMDAGTPIAGLDGLAHSLPLPIGAALAVLVAWLGAALSAAVALARKITP